MNTTATFSTAHNKAYRSLEVTTPGQRWYSFDVLTPAARAGKATKFVMTVWNFHRSEAGSPNPNPAIRRDRRTGTYWYKVLNTPVGEIDRPRTALWSAIGIADKQGLPMFGLLKDLRTKRCSLDHVFAIDAVVYEGAAEAVWLMLTPPLAGDIGCQVEVTDLPHAHGYFQRSAELTATFEEAVKKSLSMSRSARLKRLHRAPVKPRKIIVTTTAFDRNPDVVAEVLYRADGECEGCSEPAPFNRKKDGAPYLEVHHKVPLASNGDDTVENAMALCPNCHRHRHYGI